MNHQLKPPAKPPPPRQCGSSEAAAGRNRWAPPRPAQCHWRWVSRIRGRPAAVVDAAIAALNKGRTRYAPMAGSPELRMPSPQAHLQVRPGHPAEEIVLTHGGSAGLAAAMIALVNPGDRVLIPEPTYSLYADHAAMVGAECVWVPNLPAGPWTWTPPAGGRRGQHDHPVQPRKPDGPRLP